MANKSKSFFLKSLYLSTRFFMVFGLVVILFALGFAFSIFFVIAQTLFVLCVSIVLLDFILLFINKNETIYCKRTLSKVLSLGDDNKVKIEVQSGYPFKVNLSIIDELPFQLQIRDFKMNFSLTAGEKKEINYIIRPKLRGEYLFGGVNVFASTVLGLTIRKIAFSLETAVPVYPSIIQMKNFELKAFNKVATSGLRKLRRIGSSTEFAQIKNYVIGDDFKSINWKATSRRNSLMVNHFEDEKSQNIYSIIDKSRIMKMPFNGLSLLDYAINTSLVISNIALKKFDKTGLITFGDQINTVIKAENSRNQLRTILDSLYKEKEGQKEANYELLYTTLRNVVRGRSLLFLYTNFESVYGLERALPILRRLNKLHLLVVVFFENTQLVEYSRSDVETMEDIYYRSVAEKFILEKQQITYSLGNYGIQSILTRPEELSLNTVNKYLELKSRGMI